MIKLFFQISRARALVCHSCWVRADRNAQHFLTGPSGPSASVDVISENVESTLPSTSQSTTDVAVSQGTPQFTPRTSTSIILPDYLRSAETESRCFIEGCQRQERNRVPVTTRKMLLDLYKFYIQKTIDNAIITLIFSLGIFSPGF